MTYLKAFLGFALTFLVIDTVWINLVVIKLYAKDVGHLLAGQPNVIAAVCFYVFYVSGCVWFAVIKNLHAPSRAAMFSGAALGALCYATFTLTNYAVLSGWTTTIAISDIVWGAVLTGSSAFVGHWFATR